MVAKIFLLKISLFLLLIPLLLFLHVLLPPETETGIFRQILQGKLDFESEPWPCISETAKELLRKMLDRNPKKRLTAHEVLCKFFFVFLGDKQGDMLEDQS